MLHDRRPRGAVTLAVVLVAALAACGGGEEPEGAPSPTSSVSPTPSPSASESAAAGTGLARYYEQEVEWEPCRETMECTEIQVPLDYADPDGETIRLSLLKVPAEGDRVVGSLVVNPGGPGASGVDWAATAQTSFGAKVRRSFDIVGFDPRGVARSTPIDCLTDDELDELIAADPDPDTPAEVAEGDRLLTEMGRGCVARSGELAGHVSTVEAARDVDVIRALVGDRRLFWFGASYGTLLGATYAELFPERVGRMVLDGAVDPSATAEEQALVQARGFETALRSYVGSCVEDGDCFLGKSVDEGAQRIRSLLDDIDRQPISGVGERRLRIGNAVLGIWTPLYVEDYWPFLDQALQQALEGDGSGLLLLSDAYTYRAPSGYVTNMFEALYAVNCLDEGNGESVPATEVADLEPRFERASPTFGRIFAYGLSSCSNWPLDGAETPDELRAEGAPPILVVGTTRDPATPAEWAQALAAQLDSGVLVVRDGDGHTGYNAGNECIDDIVESYLVSGEVPESGVRC